MNTPTFIIVAVACFGLAAGLGRWLPHEKLLVVPPVENVPVEVVREVPAADSATWATRNPRAALEDLRSGLLPPDIAGAMVQELMERAADSDPDLAFEMLSEYSTQNGRSLKNDWFLENREAAIARLMGMPDGAHTTNTLTGLIENWAEENPLEAMENLDLGAVPSNKRFVVIRALMSGLMKSDSESARQLIAGLPDDPHQLTHARNLVNRMVDDEKNPIRAIEWVRDHFEAGELYSLLTLAVTKTTGNDPVLGIEMAYELPKNMATTGVISDSYEKWARRGGGAAAAEWISNLEDAEKRQAAYGYLASGWLDRDPAELAGWVKSLDTQMAVEITGKLRKWEGESEAFKKYEEALK